ncbi:hypothetical protein [Alkalitalea saponilacus]|uniref:Lipoprotein n=1 Tax=Alkalitalea saponilacus TaxID=889453 RepID=A0A1T5HU95_9BACT|nr:hypothetical protein [Alkalitalea saponilacus]ASB50367.1 hypothetical protein CDL62_15050 [Alkalitalea saponilacus]SKC24256.1 hypothetical protein SAMN03080601_03553 [Alkalitalea saponilacus]
MNKLYLGKWNTLILALAISIQSCAPFRALPEPINKSYEIAGIYSNDCNRTDARREKKLWELIEPKYNNITEEDLFVFLEIENDKRLKAYLINKNDTIREKQIRGKFKDDQCFYTRRTFYIVPILPILWWFRNEQDRICLSCEQLVFENTYNTGGVAIIMAGGSSGNYIWKFKKLTNKGTK